MKFLIVDDEFEIRNGLSQILRDSNWDDIPVTGIEMAGDSMEALERIVPNAIDIVITDIRMPGMDGLSLTETIQYRHPHIPVIILSGYHDKQNVVTAMRSGASDFLFKPVQLDELQGALRKTMKKARQVKRKSLHISQQQFHDLARDRFKAVIAADIRDISYARVKQLDDMNMLTWFMNKVATEFAEEREGVFFITDQIKTEPVNLLIGICDQTANQTRDTAERLSEILSQFWDGTLKLPISMGLSGVFAESNPEEYVYHAKCALFSRTLHGCTKKATFPDPRVAEESKAMVSKMRLETMIETGDLDGLAAELTLTINEQYKSGNIYTIIKALESLIVFLYQKMSSAFPDSPLKMSDLQLQLQKMLWCRSREDVIQQLIKWMHMIFGERVRDERSDHFMIKAERYILENYHRPLTLADTAEQCYLSPNYLSRLFREKKGMTFLELLTAVRIENAKRMLHEPWVRIYEIAEAVGYGSWKHFCRVFKDTTNTTPTEYRKKLDQYTPNDR